MPVRKILVVDDSPTDRQFMLETLAKKGYQVVTAENGEDAIVKAKSELPDLILMDVVMPGLNGYQATRQITRDDATKHIPVIMCTILAEPRFVAKATELGAVGFIGKPFKPEAVVKTIRGTLDASG